MVTDLRTEIKQRKPFGSVEQEAQLNLERTAAVLGHSFAEALKRFGVTPTQYNALRILRGAGKDGLCRNEVRDRMISQVPDVTRLLDRLEDAGLVERERLTTDRRRDAQTRARSHVGGTAQGVDRAADDRQTGRVERVAFAQ